MSLLSNRSGVFEFLTTHNKGAVSFLEYVFILIIIFILSGNSFVSLCVSIWQCLMYCLNIFSSILTLSNVALEFERTLVVCPLALVDEDCAGS